MNRMSETRAPRYGNNVRFKIGTPGVWFVYVIGKLEGCHKIGFSADPASRLLGFRGLPVKLSLVKSIRTTRPLWLEQYLHQLFAANHKRGEWFLLNEQDIVLLSSIGDAAEREEDLPQTVATAHAQSLRNVGRFGTHYKRLRSHKQHMEFEAELRQDFIIPSEVQPLLRRYFKGIKKKQDKVFWACFDEVRADATKAGTRTLREATQLMIAKAKAWEAKKEAMTFLRET